MRPDPDAPFEAEGVLNPASGRGPDGNLWLLPRLVAKGNVSRVGLAEVIVDRGVPADVRRESVVLSPDAGWEHAHTHGGVEDPRTTWIPDLGLHLMTYIAFGPLGPRPALAVSGDLRSWRRLGPIHFEYAEAARRRPQPLPQQGRRVLPRAGAGTGRRARLRDAAPSDVEHRAADRDGGRVPAGRGDGSPARHLDLLRAGGRCPARSAGTDPPRRPPPGRVARPTTGNRSRSAPGRRRCGSTRAGC